MLMPSIVILPPVGVSIVERTLSNVVFPEPEAPMIAINSLFDTLNDTLLRLGRCALA